MKGAAVVCVLPGVCDLLPNEEMAAESEDDEAVVVNRRNHGARVDGP